MKTVRASRRRWGVRTRAGKYVRVRARPWWRPLRCTLGAHIVRTTQPPRRPGGGPAVGSMESARRAHAQYAAPLTGRATAGTRSRVTRRPGSSLFCLRPFADDGGDDSADDDDDNTEGKTGCSVLVVVVVFFFPLFNGGRRRLQHSTLGVSSPLGRRQTAGRPTDRARSQRRPYYKIRHGAIPGNSYLPTAATWPRVLKPRSPAVPSLRCFIMTFRRKNLNF